MPARTMLLGTGKGGGGTVVTPPVIADPRPLVADPIVMAMRPRGRRIGLLRVGSSPDATHATFQEAGRAAHQIQADRLAAEGLSFATMTPNYRVDILVEPGEHVGYPEGDQKAVAWYALDTTPGSTSIINPTDPGQGRMFDPSGPTYWEGVDILTRDVVLPGGVEYDPTNINHMGPKYCIHAATMATIIITRCRLAPGAHRAQSGSAIGTDGASNGFIALHDVVMTASTNQHGWPNDKMPVDKPMVVVYSNVRVERPEGHEPFTIGYGAGSSDRPDEMWVVGGSADGYHLDGDASILHLDPAAQVGALGINAAGPRDSRTDWPVPLGGLSEYDRRRWGMPW